MEIKSELEDRYSSIPDSVYNLMDIAYIKSICKGLYIEDIKETAKELRFKFVKGYKGFEGIYSVLLKQYKDDVILYFGETPSFAIKLDNIKKEAALEYYKKLLEDISENSQKKQIVKLNKNNNTVILKRRYLKKCKVRE